MDEAAVSPLGQRLQKLIADAGYRSQNAFCKSLGVDWPTYSRWVQGKYSPGAKHLQRMAQLLRVSTDELLGVDRDPGYPGWREFLDHSALAKTLAPHERRSLEGLRFPRGQEPSVAAYELFLLHYRNVITVGEMQASRALNEQADARLQRKTRKR